MTESQPHHAAPPSRKFQLTLAGQISPRLSAPRLSADPIRFKVIAFPERIGEILELRKITYEAAQKIAPNTHPIDLTDSRDPKASFVIAESGGRIIGSVRLAPPVSGPLLYPDAMLKGPLTHIPPKSQILETAWACIHPDHQGQGLFWHLAAHMLITAKTYGKPFLIGAAEPKLWNNWRRCGYQKTGVSFERATTGREYSVIVLELAAVFEGRALGSSFAHALLPLLTASRALKPNSQS